MNAASLTIDSPLEARTLGPVILHQVDKHHDKPYLSFGARCWSYAEFLGQSQALAHGLRTIGVNARDHVAVVMSNRPEFMVAYWAAAFLNAIIVPVNAGLRRQGLAYVLRDAGASIALVDADALGGLAELDAGTLPALRGVVCVDDARLPASRPWREWRYVDLVAAHEGKPLLCEDSQFDDACLVSYTSGSTGPAKGVVASHAQCLGTSLACIDAVGILPTDVIYAPLPLFHGMSRTMGAIPALLQGAHVHLGKRFSASAFWKTVSAIQATVAVTVFTIPPTLKGLPPSADDRAHRLRVMFNAHHDRAFEDRFGVRIVEAHGMTEVGLSVYSPYPERREGASGRAAPDWEVQIVDAQDRPLPPGSVGEMVVRPRRPSLMMQGYLNKPEETAAAARNMWFHTGDLMRSDADGFFYFAGRKKERIRRRGENISPYEVESCVDRHPDVLECAAVPYPAGDGEDEVRLIVVARPGASLGAQTLADWLDLQLARYMWPRFIEFVDALPRTPSGKLEKLGLVESALPTKHWDRLSAAREPISSKNHGVAHAK